jgi:hypothetical protein
MSSPSIKQKQRAGNNSDNGLDEEYQPHQRQGRHDEGGEDSSQDSGEEGCNDDWDEGCLDIDGEETLLLLAKRRSMKGKENLKTKRKSDFHSGRKIEGGDKSVVLAQRLRTWMRGMSCRTCGKGFRGKDWTD